MVKLNSFCILVGPVDICIGLSTQAHKSVFSPFGENLADETASNEVKILDTRETDLVDQKLSEATKHDLYKAMSYYHCVWNTVQFILEDKVVHMAPRLHQLLLSLGASNDNYQSRATHQSSSNSQALGMVCPANGSNCPLS